jgi:hypothetical protein
MLIIINIIIIDIIILRIYILHINLQQVINILVYSISHKITDLIPHRPTSHIYSV